MEDGLLSLKWNNHKSTFFHILSGLRKKGTYTDATLACEGNFFPVHKLVMSTCSDYFGEVFERTTCKSPVVILKDIRHHDLEALLDYMYLGEVDVKQSELAGLIKAAECLKIKGLAVPDEDPLLSQKKTTTHVPESRSSPVAKRSRRESGEADGPHHHYGSHKARRSLSPTPSRSHPSSTSTSVPSQSVNSDSLSQVPSHTMPPPLYSDTRQLPEFSSDGDVQKHPDQSLVPVDMIKVEVDDEGNNNNSQIRRQDGPSEPNDRREEPRGEGGGGDSSDGLREDKDSMSNSYPNYSSHPGEIEKEEHDQLDTYNGSDQIPGPSGVQGVSLLSGILLLGIVTSNLGFRQNISLKSKLLISNDFCALVIVHNYCNFIW
ncbi:UNVERIFIED_CONTAM: hypothetical protein GTU68_065518 [Idotea baltica]|nr:hypothetical protein [Idotea baltica]